MDERAYIIRHLLTLIGAIYYTLYLVTRKVYRYKTVVRNTMLFYNANANALLYRCFFCLAFSFNQIATLAQSRIDI